MNRNVESHFSELPKIDIERSIFDRSASHKTSFNIGELIPFYIDEVLPGDTFNVTTSCIVRLQTPLTPIMDNIYLDTYYFYVPSRILWSHWKEFMGENTSSSWIPETTYTVPKLIPPSETGWISGTIADYLGIPIGITVTENTYINAPSALPFRAYTMICNEWFRDQNLTDPCLNYFGDENIAGSNGDNYITDVGAGGKPFKVAKYHDYFTSCTKAPQKGPSVGLFPSVASESINQSGYYKRYAPVFARSQQVSFSDMNVKTALGLQDSSTRNLLRHDNTDVKWTGSSSGLATLVPDNLWADMSEVGITINELRMAFQLQKYFEKNARAGTRYREILKEHFGITSSDARMQIPEYLGGHRIPLSIHQVANQSQGESDFLGDLGAMSNTSDVHEDFIRSFEEHGYIIGVCCARYDHSYPQGLERFWTRKRNTDFYYPVFANIGEQAVLKDEIYWQSYMNQTIGENAVFGYQEAWADYRYKPSRVSGEMRPGVDNSLAVWHLADYYSDQPTLSDEWIREDKSNVDRVLSVTSDVSNQIFADFYVKNIATRPMPMYSIPGLIDHH